MSLLKKKNILLGEQIISFKELISDDKGGIMIIIITFFLS